MLIGIVATMLTFGLLLARIFTSAAAARAAQSLTPAPYLAAIETFVIAFPMLVVAFATLLVSHSLFPDEIDFRVLLALPVSRRVVFLSKLAALSLFAGIFIVVAHVAMLPLFHDDFGGATHGQESVLARLGAHVLASLGGSVFAVLAVTAIYGALLMGVPRAPPADRVDGGAKRDALRARAVPAARGENARDRAAARRRIADAVSRPAGLVPRLRGAAARPRVAVRRPDGAHRRARARLVARAGGRQLCVALSAIRPGDAAAGQALRRIPPTRRCSHGRTAASTAAAITGFTHLTLARSALHQGVFVAIAACGAGLVMNSFLGAMTMPRMLARERASSTPFSPRRSP